MNENDVIIDVKDLHKSYGQTEVIKGVDMTVRKSASSDRPAPANPPYCVA